MSAELLQFPKANASHCSSKDPDHGSPYLPSGDVDIATSPWGAHLTFDFPLGIKAHPGMGGYASWLLEGRGPLVYALANHLVVSFGLETGDEADQKMVDDIASCLASRIPNASIGRAAVKYCDFSKARLGHLVTGASSRRTPDLTLVQEDGD